MNSGGGRLATGNLSERLPAWLFPVPVRQSRFHAVAPAFADCNIEVAQDRIGPFCFATTDARQILYYDLQTQLNANYRGRHGSGRSGIYCGRYLKGVGRTPAAANWNDGDDIYHASGHLSVGSALRELLITRALAARGLAEQDCAVPEHSAWPLRDREKRAIRRGQTSSSERFAPADGHMIALTVKPSDFARLSNFVFALDHFEGTAAQIGELFLDLEQYLHPPGARGGLEGAPRAIAWALDAAFRRGLENFREYARAGLFWLYLNSNFSLDGRFFDLETPVFFGAPFVGVAVAESDKRKELLGFEEFDFVQHWRLFLSWFKARLRFLSAREISGISEARWFLRKLSREITARFPRGHVLFDDGKLIAQATANLANALGLNRPDRSRVLDLARYAFEWRVYSTRRPLPDLGWRALDFAPAPATPFPRRYETAGFLRPAPAADAVAFAVDLERLGGICDPARLLRELRKLG